jgi:uncharacterized protein YjdB
MSVRPIAIGRPEPLKSLCGSALRTATGLVVGLALGAVSPIVRPASAQAVADLQVSPDAVTVGVGQKQTLFVAAFDRQGNVLPTARFAFASSDTTIARVNGDGVVVGLRAGLARVDVLAQSRKVAIAVFVTAPGGSPADPRPDTRGDTRADAAAALRLDPPALTLLPGETARITGTPLHPDGSTAPAVPLTWRSLRPSIATVSTDGTVSAVAPGEAVVQATGRGPLAATAAVTVAPAEFALSRTAIVRGPNALDSVYATVPAQGGRLVGGGLAWRAADSTIVRVGPTGIIQTLAAGETDVIASGLGQERRVHVTVYRRPEILVLAPRPAAGAVVVPLGGAGVLGIRALAADSTAVPQVPVTWEVGDTTIVALDRVTGRVTARALGTTSVTARVEGFDPALWVVTVISGDIALDHPRLGLAAAERATLVPRYADSTAGPLAAGASATRFDWTTDHPAVATVTPDGAVTAVAPGRAVVTAWAPWGRTASADVFVTGDFLVSSNRAGKGFAIYQATLAAPDSLTRVLADTAASVQAVWSPDRTRIAFSSNRSGNYDLYVMDADGGNVQRIAAGAGTDGEPAWSPDGRRIVFVSARAGAPQLYSVAVDGTDLRPLTSTGASASPAFSPDGHTIAFTSSRDGNYEVYLMDADGANQRRITTTPGRELAPRFLPGGELAWVVDRGARSGSAIVRQSGATLTVMAEVPATIVAWSLSRDGRTLAYVTGRLGSSRSATEFSLMLRPVAGAAVPVRLGATEQPVTPSF